MNYFWGIFFVISVASSIYAMNGNEIEAAHALLELQNNTTPYYANRTLLANTLQDLLTTTQQRRYQPLIDALINFPGSDQEIHEIITAELENYKKNINLHAPISKFSLNRAIGKGLFARNNKS